MESSFHGLPPFKRYKLIQQQQQQQKEPPSIINPPEKNSTPPSCLPAKKRKQISPISNAESFCLPAKKRIWAPHPFDLNLEYDHDHKQKEEKIVAIDDDGIICAVCGSTDADPSDPIVLCDGCDLMVHASCYGHPLSDSIPQGDWYCDQCSASNNKKRNDDFTCCLCPVPGGALKPTVDGKWAHLVCAIYVPEVFFNDPEGRRGIVCNKVLKRRWENECCVCEAKNVGCVIDCSEPRCALAFHVTCGLKEGLCIEYRQGKRNKGDVVAAFCAAHSDLWKKQEQTGKYKIVARDDYKS